MSPKQQTFLDPRTQRPIHLDPKKRAWVYADGTPYVANAPSNEQPEDNDDEDEEEEEDESSEPRSRHHEQTERAWRARDHASSSSSHDRPSSISQYTTDPENAMEQLSSGVGNVQLDEGSHESGDTTPTPVQLGYLLREPAESVSDPALLKKGIRAHGRIRETVGDSERLDPGYKKQANPSSFFVSGRVFRILWPEQPGVNTNNVTVITDGKFVNSEIITKIRWFVVVKTGSNFCSCLPISTYSYRGCGKPGVTKWQHSKVHTASKEPASLPGEEAREGEDPMMSWIKVIPSRKGSKMHVASRIDYSRLYTVEHYVKVRDFGTVDDKYLKRLKAQWKHVFSRDLNGGPDDQSDEETPTRFLCLVYVNWDFSETNMMAMKAGDQIGVTAKTTDAWWTGQNFRTGEQNIFPVQYVSVVQGDQGNPS